jgi:hypothetical protein
MNFKNLVNACAVVILTVACADIGTVKRNPGSAEVQGSKDLNPFLAKVTLSSAQLMPASEGSTIQVPGFSVSMSNANYVEILRCVADYKMAVPDGTLVDKVTTTLDVRRSQMKWAWNNAKNSMSDCRIVAINSGRSTFTDLSATSGNWRYHAVGCVSANMLKETQKTEPCNYEIASTSSVVYDGQLRTDFLQKAQTFADAEGRLYGVLTELYRLAGKIAFEQEICIGDYQQKRYLEEATKGALALFKTVIGIAASVFTAGTGGAILGAMKTGFNVIDLAAGTSPGTTTYSCPNADLAVKQLKNFKDTYTEALADMIKVRKELAELDSRYVAMGDLVEEEFNKLKGGSTGGASTAPSSGGTSQKPEVKK